MSKKNSLAVIPARYQSTRFPGKPLALIKGRPMIQWVYEKAKRSVGQAIVATDDKRIFNVVREFGGNVMMTPRSCKSGTDRMHYVSKKKKALFYVNVQGDEPAIKVSTIRKTLSMSVKTKEISTAATPLKKDEVQDPNAVKVIVGHKSRAIHFARQGFNSSVLKNGNRRSVYKHLGLYVYPKEKLNQFVNYPQPAIEREERLEQLRALYFGLPIFVSVVKDATIGVDRPADVKLVEKILN